MHWPAGVDVYDTAGILLHSFGTEGPEQLIHATAIRVFGDAVYVHDVRNDTIIEGKSAGARIRKFTKSGKLLVMGSYKVFPGNIRKTQSALMAPDLSPGPRTGSDFFLNAYAGEAESDTWIVRDDSLIQEWDKDSELTRQIRLPESLYRDIQIQSGVIYLYDYTAGAIRIYRRP